jgi:aspartyl/asparaginyl beta-hydroxylase (cupin superfamily)
MNYEMQDLPTFRDWAQRTWYLTKKLFGKRLIALDAVLISKTSDARHPFLAADGLAWAKRLEDNWTRIRDEVRLMMPRVDQITNEADLYGTDMNPTNASVEGQWKLFVLYAFGIPVEQNLARCPNTAALLSKVPGIINASFSVFRPHTHVSAHRGPHKGIHRYHLGLIVPRAAEKCRIRAGTQVRHWIAGRSFILDDTYEHEVWNETDEDRIVLIIDYPRRLPFPLSLFNWWALHTYRMSPQDIHPNKDHAEPEHGHEADQTVA